ncbi:hypothetical protein KUCAC02_029949 [Chaenocephalus aceratus]|uniref:Uncharacterized protein n=1 Tax=Chaenocephalus aceratus TaxID=36190 RepID=A0ACB9XIM3_CHAAC|nr:hypothetical protein KUCAC02_029949 [Chaenocephalus aceratus]
MAQELELSEYATIQHDLQGTEEDSGAYEQSAVLCILQATLNLSLGLAFYSKEDTDQIPFNSSMIADVCQINQTQLHSKNKLYSCYKKLLGELLKENQAPGPERNTSSDEGSGLTTNTTADYDDYFYDEYVSGAFDGY